MFEYFKEFKKFKELDRSLIVNLVDRINVGENHNIIIDFTFKDPFKDLLKDYKKNVANVQLK